MHNFVMSFMEDSALYLIDINDSIDVDRVATPDYCAGIRSIRALNEMLLFCCEYTDTLCCYNRYTKRYKLLCNTIGKAPYKLCPWNNYLVVLCKESDSIELCPNNGCQSIIFRRLGSVLTDISIQNHMCFCTSLQDSKLYILSLPLLEVIAVHSLPIKPFALEFIKDDIYILGIYESFYKIIKINKIGELSHILSFSQYPCCIYSKGNSIYISCSFDDIIYKIQPGDTVHIKCNKLGFSPHLITFNNESSVLVTVKSDRYKLIYTKNKKAVGYINTSLPSAWHISCLTNM